MEIDLLRRLGLRLKTLTRAGLGFLRKCMVVERLGFWRRREFGEVAVAMVTGRVLSEREERARRGFWREDGWTHGCTIYSGAL